MNKSLHVRRSLDGMLFNLKVCSTKFLLHRADGPINSTKCRATENQPRTVTPPPELQRWGFSGAQPLAAQCNAKKWHMDDGILPKV